MIRGPCLPCLPCFWRGSKGPETVSQSSQIHSFWSLKKTGIFMDMTGMGWLKMRRCLVKEGSCLKS